MRLPARLGLFSAARTVFDELQAIHQKQAYAVHKVVRMSLSARLARITLGLMIGI